jgi:hypothetical protein
MTLLDQPPEKSQSPSEVVLLLLPADFNLLLADFNLLLPELNLLLKVPLLEVSHLLQPKRSLLYRSTPPWLVESNDLKYLIYEALKLLKDDLLNSNPLLLPLGLDMGLLGKL